MKLLPERIVCLTTETVEVLYMLGEQDRIVGISGYTTRPEIARREKPKVSAFTTANIDKILALKPDLVLGFFFVYKGCRVRNVGNYSSADFPC